MSELDDETLSTTDWDLVVIGRGYSALVNCMTRLGSGTLPKKTLLIGKTDPWKTFVNHRMGQHAPFLSLPGYHLENQPRQECFQGYLESKTFGHFNQKQLEYLLENGHVSIATGVIEEPFSHANNRWLIPVNNEKSKLTIKSQSVDICSGPGFARRFDLNQPKIGGPWDKNIRNAFDEKRREQLKDNSSDEAIIAERFMQLHCGHKNVVVVGEGPLSASAVEHALACGANNVFWVGRPLEMAQRSFPESTRYDDLIANASELRQLYSSIDHDNDDIKKGYIGAAKEFYRAISPRNAKLTIALGLVNSVSKIDIGICNAKGFELVVLKNNKLETQTGSTKANYDQLVVSASSENTIHDVRSVARMLQSISKIVSSTTPFQPLHRGGMFVGLEVHNQSLRVLGAPSRNDELMRQCLALQSAEETKYRTWVTSLSPQIRMPNYAMGITIGAATIAHANNFYNRNLPDLCIQTAVLDNSDLRDTRGKTSYAMESAQLNDVRYEIYPRNFETFLAGSASQSL